MVMMECSFYFNLVLLLLFSSSSSSSSSSSLFSAPYSMVVAESGRCHDEERAALLQFRHSFVINDSTCNSYWSYDGTPKLESWKEGGDCCGWDGVECDDRNDHHVVGLDLSGSCLFGSINSSSSLFTLTHLQKLNLSYNDFNSSHIPDAIGNLSRLTHLNLSASYIGGRIPQQQLSSITTLVSLDLSLNTGRYPSPGLELRSLKGLVQHMTHLKELHLSDVSMNSSAVPHLLSNFSSLESLLLQACELKGEFPAAIFDLPELKMLDLSNNDDLKGYLPNFRSSSPLRSLRLESTSFGGLVPPSIGNLVSLEELYITDCEITGKLPMSLGNLTQLVSLDGLIGIDHYQFSADSYTTTSLSWIGKLTKLTTLDLRYMDLTGNIPSWIMNLTRLTLLDISNNQLTGPIPSSLMNLTRLSVLDISSNQLTGPIPSSLMNLTRLSELSMGENQLTGPISSSFTNLPRLVSMSLSYNQLTGQIPSQFNHLIEWLDLSYNSFEGSIPTNLSTLPKLEFLLLEHNKLVGSVELSIFSHFKRLTRLVLSHNDLALTFKNSSEETSFPSLKELIMVSCNLREFPTFLYNYTNTLEHLDLSANKMRGQIPSWISDMSRNTRDGVFLNLSYNLLSCFEQNHPDAHPRGKIQILDLRNNELQGSLPVLPPSSSSTLSALLISNNNFSGEVPQLICNLTSLEHLDLSHNNFSGKLPLCLSNLSDSLLTLNIADNKIEGSIPSLWRNGCQLQMLNVSNNLLQGQLPRSLAKCSMLSFLDFSNNKFMDTFPFWLGTLTELSVLILRSNNLRGVINDGFEFSNLRIIDLSNNSFGGKLPAEFINTSNVMKVSDSSDLMAYMGSSWVFKSSSSIAHDSFEYSMTIYNKGSKLSYQKISDIFCGIDFSSNNFEGQIPRTFGDLVGLELLNLSRNHLSGPIPSSISTMKNLECLDLSQNQLSGQIPTELTKLTFLSSFNVSFNNLSGHIPQGNQFCNYDPKSYEGNPGLSLQSWNLQCGNARSSPQPQPPPSPTEEEEEDSESDFKIKWMIITTGFVSGLVVGVILGNELIARKPYWFVKTLARIGIW